MSDKTDNYNEASNNGEGDSTERGETRSNNLENSPINTQNENINANAIDIEKERLEKELREAKAKAQENWDLLLRTKAEIENVRRRASLDVEKAHKFSIESLARELLHVIDSLDKGLEVSINGSEQTGSNQIESMQQGIQLTHKLFIDTLEKFGIKEINPLGEIFDPSKHEALSIQEREAVEHNSILMVVQKGFSIHDRILRPARVIVAKSIPSSAPKIDERA